MRNNISCLQNKVYKLAYIISIGWIKAWKKDNERNISITAYPKNI